MTLSFNVGKLASSGTGSVPFVPANPGFRGETNLSFNVEKAVPVTLNILDENNAPPRRASRSVTTGPGLSVSHQAIRTDLFFQNQVYRYDGETVELPPGEYTVEYARGPQYERGTRTITVAANKPMTEKFSLKRWINPRAQGYVSLDKHVHTAGCLHYNDPAYGIEPKDMLRYTTGEDLDAADILIWGPNWYYQKRSTSPVSQIGVDPEQRRHAQSGSVAVPEQRRRSHQRHGMKDIDYPGTKKIQDWPSYTLPVLKWMQSQGALSSYTHSGFGLDVQTADLPNYITPRWIASG